MPSNCNCEPGKLASRRSRVTWHDVRYSVYLSLGTVFVMRQVTKKEGSPITGTARNLGGISPNAVFKLSSTVSRTVLYRYCTSRSITQAGILMYFLRN